MHKVPTFISDSEDIVRDIDRRFGEKRKIGLFHSLSTLTALHQAAGNGGFSGLVLFDPPICPPGGFPHDLQDIGRRLGMRAQAPGQIRDSGRFLDVSFPNGDVRARASRRGGPHRPDDASPRSRRPGLELCCPRDYEAQIFEYIFCWTMTLDLERVACPVKAIGADPVAGSFMLSMDLGELERIDYDYIPEGTHLLQLEEPETCAAMVLEFVEDHGLG